MMNLSQLKKLKIKYTYIRTYYDPSYDENKYKTSYKFTSFEQESNSSNNIFFDNKKLEEYISKKVKEEIKKYFNKQPNEFDTNNKLPLPNSKLNPGQDKP